MMTRRTAWLALAGALMLGLAVGPASADTAGGGVGPGFTYQGELDNGSGQPITGTCDFLFDLFDSPNNITGMLGNTSVVANVSVVDGYFTALVNANGEFGASAFNGSSRWLAILVRCPAGSGSFTPLTGRQPLTPEPYSLFSLATGPHNHWGQDWVGAGNGLILDARPPYDSAAGLKAYSRASIGVAIQAVDAMTNSDAGMLAPTAVSGINLLPAAGFNPRAFGVYGAASGVGGYGVVGYATYTGTAGFADQGSNSATGVYGEALGSNGTGVYGNGSTNGVYGVGANGVAAYSNVYDGNGVRGEADSGSLAYGVEGVSSSGYAGWFTGNVYVSGNISTGGAKPFKIDDPLDPANEYLYHYAVESPQVEDQYNGTVTLDANGQAVVQLPDYFSAVNTGDYQYYLTAIGAPMPNLYIAQEIQGNTFKIAGGVAGKKVSWMVYGQRNDPWLRDHPQPVVAPKGPGEAGTYLYPQGYGQPDSKSLEAARDQQLQSQSSVTTTTTTPSNQASPWTWVKTTP